MMGMSTSAFVACVSLRLQISGAAASIVVYIRLRWQEYEVVYKTKASTPEVKAEPQAVAELASATMYPSLGGFQAASSPLLPPHGRNVRPSHRPGLERATSIVFKLRRAGWLLQD
jgi:hypothetical protein